SSGGEAELVVGQKVGRNLRRRWRSKIGDGQREIATGDGAGDLPFQGSNIDCHASGSFAGTLPNAVMYSARSVASRSRTYQPPMRLCIAQEPFTNVESSVRNRNRFSAEYVGGSQVSHCG